MVRHAEFCLVMFFFLLMVFGWPFIAIPGAGFPRTMYLYLFGVWGASILLLLLIGSRNDDHGGVDGD